MDDAHRTSRDRLEILRQAEASDSVNDVCARHGISRTLLYRWKRRYQEAGLLGLNDRPPIARAHPRAIADEVRRQTIELSISNPAASFRELARLLDEQGAQLSAVTVRKILKAAGLASPNERARKLEDELHAGQTTLTPRQMRFVEATNPNLRQRDLAPTAPGSVLIAGIISLTPNTGARPTQLAAVLDAFSSYAVVDHPSCDSADSAERAIVNAFRTYGRHGFRVCRLIVANHRAFRRFTRFTCHQIGVRVRFAPAPLGYIERFERHLRDDLVSKAEGIADDQLAQWLADYNTTGLSGYPNFGRSPAAILGEHAV